MEFLAPVRLFFASHLPAVTWSADMGLKNQTALHTSEENLVSGAVEKRQREFRAGRNLAHEVMEQMGCQRRPLLRCPKGAPVWPVNLVGSLSHCDDLAICTMARRYTVRMLGVDVEGAAALHADLLPLIMTDNDFAVVPKPGLAQGLWGKCVFSAKESAYKALHPKVQRVLDFSDIVIKPLHPVSSSTGGFKVVSSDGDVELKSLCNQLSGYWIRLPTHIITVAYSLRKN